jgi:hypothetical protein
LTELYLKVLRRMEKEENLEKILVQQKNGKISSSTGHCKWQK